MIKLGELEVDILNRTVRTGASELRLASLEQNLLYLLAANAGRVVTREEISTGMGADYVVESNVVDRQIRDLRARLHDNWKRPQFISPVPRRGYQFLLSVSNESHEAQATSASVSRSISARLSINRLMAGCEYQVGVTIRLSRSNATTSAVAVDSQLVDGPDTFDFPPGGSLIGNCRP